MKFPLFRLLTVAAALAGAALLRAEDAASVATSAPSAPGRLAAGDAAPDFTVEGPKGEKVSLADFKGKVLIVDVSATWCGPCKALAPIVEKIADEYAGQIRVGKCDIDDSPGTAAKYGVRSVPTVMVFKNGQKVAQHVGLTNRDKLVALLGLS